LTNKGFSTVAVELNALNFRQSRHRLSLS